MNEKACRVCGETKPIDQFRKHSQRVGVRTICRFCENAATREYKAATRPERTPTPSAPFLVEREAWMADAACRDAATGKFFPTQGENFRAALAVCETCPVKAECLAYAEKIQIDFGVWGGTTAKERTRRRRQRQQRGAAA